MITEMIAGLRRYKTGKGNGSMYIIHTNPSEDHTHTHTPSNSLQKEEQMSETVKDLHNIYTDMYI